MRRAALLLLAALALAGCGGGDESAAPAPTSPPDAGGVRELENVLQLRSDFEAGAGATRVVLLFSPT